MISWIQKYFQQHFKTIFAVLLAVTIISFVMTIGATPGIGNGERRGVTERPFFGYNLASRDDQTRLFNDARLSAELQSGYPLDGDDLQNYAFQRAGALDLANKLHLPAASKADIADYIKTLRVFTGNDGQFDTKRYASFRDSLKSNPGMNENTVSRVLGDDVRINRVQKLLAGPGYVQPADVKTTLERADTKWTLSVATVDYTAFSPDVSVTEAELKKYFDESGARYDIPPRVSVDYVGFPAITYLFQVRVTDQEVRAYYDANPARFPAPKKDDKAAKPAVPANPDADFAAVKPQVESALKLERAQQLAMKAASDFSYALYESKARPGTPAFTTLLNAQKLTLSSLKPFTRDEGPAEFGGAPQIAEEAFKLGADHPTSDAINTPAGAAILFWKETLPSRHPLFTEVHDKVSADYTADQKRKRFVDAGHTLHDAIERRLKAGDDFAKAVAASAGNLKVDTKSVPAFTLRQPPQDIDYAALRSLEHADKGTVTDMIVDQNKGLIVYVADKQLPDLSDKNPKYAQTMEQMAAMNGRQNASAFLTDYVEAELKRSEPKTP